MRVRQVSVWDIMALKWRLVPNQNSVKAIITASLWSKEIWTLIKRISKWCELRNHGGQMLLRGANLKAELRLDYENCVDFNGMRERDCVWSEIWPVLVFVYCGCMYVFVHVCILLRARPKAERVFAEYDNFLKLSDPTDRPTDRPTVTLFSVLYLLNQATDW